MGGDNGNGRSDEHFSLTAVDVQLAPIRSALWEYMRNKSLASCASQPRNSEDDGDYCTGASEYRIHMALDFHTMLTKAEKYMSSHRKERFNSWVLDGTPPQKFGQVERCQLHNDAHRLERYIIGGGYGWLLGTCRGDDPES